MNYGNLERFTGNRKWPNYVYTIYLNQISIGPTKKNVYWTRSHQTSIRKWPMPENDKSGTEEKKFSIHCVQGGQKDGRKSLSRSRNPLLSAAMVQNRLERSTRLLNYLKNYGNWILVFFYEKTFIVDHVFNKQIDRVVTFGNDISEERKVSTTSPPTSIMILGVVASNGEKIPPVWCKWG